MSTLRVDTTIFQRTDFPQSAPLRTVPEALLDPRDFYAAWYSQAQSFRVKQRPLLDLHGQEWHPDSTPLFKVPLSLLEVQDFYAAWYSEARSFRLRESLPVDKFERTDFPQSAPLLKVPLSLLEVQDFFAAWHSETQAFRSLEREKLSLSQHLTQPQVSWLFVPLNLVDFDLSVVTSAAEQLFRSFRLRDRTLDKLERTDFPQVAPLFFDVLGLLDVPVGVAAWMAHTQSFRSREGSRFDSTRHLTQPQLAWLKDVLGLTEEEITGGFDYRLFAMRKTRR